MVHHVCERLSGDLHTYLVLNIIFLWKIILLFERNLFTVSRDNSWVCFDSYHGRLSGDKILIEETMIVRGITLSQRMYTLKERKINLISNFNSLFLSLKTNFANFTLNLIPIGQMDEFI